MFVRPLALFVQPFMNRDKNCAKETAKGIVLIFTALVGSLFLASCETTSTGSLGGTSGKLPAAAYSGAAVQQRNAQIIREQPGNHYIGRRWWVDGTRFWGYLRKPGQPWVESSLIIMNESLARQPDRISEEGEGRIHGFDHNFEYRIWGSFTGATVYDPNSNFLIPEFRITRYELISERPGFLFYPGERYNPRKLPPKHPPLQY